MAILVEKGAAAAKLAPSKVEKGLANAWVSENARLTSQIQESSIFEVFSSSPGCYFCPRTVVQGHFCPRDISPRRLLPKETLV